MRSATEPLVLVPIGTGAGSTQTYFGEPSSCFAISRSGKCELLVDLGLGVTRPAMERFGSFPERVFVTHNHSDHSGELPVVAMTLRARASKLNIFSGPEVQVRLREHRLHEFVQAGILPDELADWHACPEGARVEIAPGLALETRRGHHSEACYGLRLFHQGRLVLGYTADSGFDPDFYEWLAEAPLLIADGRARASADHAGFDEIAAFTKGHPNLDVRVTHYGRQEERPVDLPSLRIGEEIQLD